HFYAGILIGPFLLVAAVTGLLYTATPQIEAVVYRQELTVTLMVSPRRCPPKSPPHALPFPRAPWCR
ncbi:PepSY-associated TM helix domain-containing protein, partial [Streptomyces sp. RKAG290]|uniref:PepSY-associated TM helix domain-containing protein n=1 Tax=Streptomyces sp. RKAG290 TaxID=2888348 RepID=UPI0020347D68